jgi:hydroxymethylbilane synthase
MTTLAVVAGDNVPKLEQESIAISEFNVGTRKSALALAQTDLVVKALAEVWPDYKYNIKARDTAAGDIDKVTPFKDMPVKNIWTHELETLMLEKKLHFLVHSLKDVPTQLPPNCEVGAVLERGDPRDVLCIKAGRESCKISDLPPGAVVGTSSIRRTAQVALQYPHLIVKDIRGNVGTRLSKLDADDGQFDAIIIAAAGLHRLNLGHRISQYLDFESSGMLHAVGQGAIGIENGSDDDHVQNMLMRINHKPTFLAVTVERSLLRTIEGGCSAPLGVETKWLDPAEEGSLKLKAVVVSTDGKDYASIDMTEKVTTVEEADQFGLIAAHQLLHRGAAKILAEIKAKKPTTVIDLEEK